ncbi:hypothetical protein BU17DRAFT_64215 [Hysterangium stoloniferum]|nr:hypothetical protein BU17DRAFT_64215 [Hysterangium stoloniferum]
MSEETLAKEFAGFIQLNWHAITSRRATNYFGFSSFTILLYDHLLTFGDEVQYVWRGKKTLVSWLFLLPIPQQRGEIQCKRFVRFEGAMTFLGVAVALIIMGFRRYSPIIVLHRVSALYRGNVSVVVLLGVIYVGVFGTGVWLLSNGELLVTCVEVSFASGTTRSRNSRKNAWGSLWAWMPLLYDTVVLVLVLRLLRIRAPLHRNEWGRDRLVTALITDGLLYYSIICASNLTLGIMITTAPISGSASSDSQRTHHSITVVMMSRITLNVREHMEADPQYPSFLETPNIPRAIDTPVDDISMQGQIPLVASPHRPTFVDTLL